jgi:hypothetical protein
LVLLSTSISKTLPLLGAHRAKSTATSNDSSFRFCYQKILIDQIHTFIELGPRPFSIHLFRSL